MALRYVPPHQRNKSNNDNRPTLISNDENLGLRKLADLKLSEGDERPLHTLMELCMFYGSISTHSTLHESADDRSALAYLVLFRNENPRWKADNIIFAQHNLQVLPGYEPFERNLNAFNIMKSAGGDMPDRMRRRLKEFAASPDQNTETVGNPKNLPVFMELGMPLGVYRRFVFHGFFTLADVQFLMPQSQELVKMLEEKWQFTRPGSDQPLPPSMLCNRAAWQKDLNESWAVIKLQKDPEDEWPPQPQIPVLSDEVQASMARGERGRKGTKKRVDPMDVWDM